MNVDEVSRITPVGESPNLGADEIVQGKNLPISLEASSFIEIELLVATSMSRLKRSTRQCA